MASVMVCVDRAEMACIKAIVEYRMKEKEFHQVALIKQMCILVRDTPNPFVILNDSDMVHIGKYL